MGFRQLLKGFLAPADDRLADNAEPSLARSATKLQPDEMELVPEERLFLDAQLEAVLRIQRYEDGFQLAATALKNGRYAHAIYLYRRIAAAFPDVRHDCEGQLGMTYYCLGQYRKAIESYIAARVHGADPAWMDETIWEACETMARDAKDPVSAAEQLNLYLRLCPKGQFRPQAELMLRTTA